MEQMTYKILVKRKTYSYELQSKFPETDWRNQLTIFWIDSIIFLLKKQLYTFIQFRRDWSFDDGLEEERERAMQNTSVQESWRMVNDIYNGYFLGEKGKEKSDLSNLLDSVRQNYHELKIEESAEIEESQSKMHCEFKTTKNFTITKFSFISNFFLSDFRSWMFPMLVESYVGAIMEYTSRYAIDEDFLLPLKPSTGPIDLKVIIEKVKSSKELKMMLRVVRKSLIHKYTKAEEKRSKSIKKKEPDNYDPE